MARKPDIQYVGQFYIHGSEARELARQEQAKHAKTMLPMSRLQQVQKIYVDPVAVMGLVVAVVMLVVMIIGAVSIHNAWTEHKAVAAYLAQLKVENGELDETYRSGYDLEDIRTKALAMGMVPMDQANVIDIRVTVPVVEQDPTWWEDMVWLLEGLIE